MTAAAPHRSRLHWLRVLLWPRLDELPLLGDTGVGRLLPVQALHSIGETMFAVSLVGSLFFNVSLDAARPRIVLYLAVTMAPFLVLAPLIGPLIDRVRGGHRMVLLASLGGRALLAVFLATQLKGLLFYPLAFAMLVLAKVFSVSRNSLIPVLVTNRSQLVVVNSRLARAAAVSGALGAPFAIAILQAWGSEWTLRAGAIVYAAGALMAMALPPPHPEENASPVVEQMELAGPGVRSATLAMGSLRTAMGFVVFHLGFVLKRGGEPAWLFGLVAAAISIGGFAGTFAAPRLRRRLGEQLTLTVALIAPAIAALVAALRFHRVTAIALAAVVGLGVSVARRAFDCVVQAEAPHARRGQAYAGLEARLEMGWAAGALTAVVVSAPGWVGAAALTAWLGVIGVARLGQYRRAARNGSNESTLPLRLLETAEALLARGDSQQAAAVAVAATEALNWRAAPAARPVAEPRELGSASGTDRDEDAAVDVVRRAHEIVSESYRAPGSSDSSA